ncbi:glycosyltransferase [Dietzia sp. 179-F 9C3 NHS]|uniref:glycosyltransferase n=1 Tax=Dietzia sp. 179-F 9C3 NHS TaxID=3374295 RepID=UPI0038798616
MKLATWFGPVDASLFGVLEFPGDRRVRAGVVVVPSLGIEQVTTYRGLRALTERLVRDGFVTLRYDHSGTGSSTGDQLDEDAWARWTRGVPTAVDTLRALGVEDVTVVAVRAGCLVVDAAYAADDVARPRVVHWDPPVSGQRFLREQTAKYKLTVGDDPADPGTSVLGGHFSTSTAASLRAARWSGRTPAALVAARPLEMDDPALAPLLDGADRLELRQSDLFTAPLAFIHHVPLPDIDALGSWLAAAAGPGYRSISPSRRETAVVGRRSDGSRVLETVRPVTDRALHLFTTYVEGEEPKGGIVFQSTANEPPWGPTRAWVEAARDNAGAGLACHRFDKTGGGEAGTVTPGEIAVLYSHASRRDAVDVLGTLGLPAQNLLLVGLCSGGWMSAESAIRSRAGAVLLFGMIQWSRVREPVTKTFLDEHGYNLEKQIPPTTESRRARLKPLARNVLPYRIWEALGRRGTTQVPGPLLADLMSAGARVTVALTPEDEEHFTTQRGDEGLRRLRRRGFIGQIRRIDTPRGDHNLYRPDARASAARLVSEEADALRSRLGLPTVEPTSSPITALFVNENIGGHATVHSALRTVLADRKDIEADFLDAHGPGPIGRVLRAPVPGLDRLDLDLQPLRGQLVHSWSVKRRVRDRLARGDIDVIHLYTQNCMLGGAGLLRRTPTVITTDSTGRRNVFSIPYRTPTRFTARLSLVNLLWERPVLHAAHHVFANSVPVVESLTSSDYGLPPERVTRLEMGIWSPFLSTAPPERNRDRRPTIVFLGTSMERKGGHLLLDVWRRAFRDTADLLLITLDPVPEEEGLRVVGDLAPGDARLWDLLADSDIMCFPSVIDQAPNAVLEGAAAGLPVIAHPGGAIPEMVVDGETGLLVDGADPDAVESALRTLVTDPDLRRRMGAAGHLHVVNRYSIVGSADTIVTRLHDAARKGTRP